MSQALDIETLELRVADDPGAPGFATLAETYRRLGRLDDARRVAVAGLAHMIMLRISGSIHRSIRPRRAGFLRPALTARRGPIKMMGRPAGPDQDRGPTGGDRV